MLKLIACDVDGTLIPTGESQIHERLFPIIRRLHACGVQFIACSGRQYYNLRQLFAPVADEIGYICENGSLTMWKGQATDIKEIDRGEAVRLMRCIMEQEDCEVLLSTERCCYVQPKEEEYYLHVRDFVGNLVKKTEDICAIQEPFIKISLYQAGGIDPELQKKMNAFTEPYMRGVIGGVRWLDFQQNGCNKGIALEQFLQTAGYEKEECLAVGDNENDLSLIGAAGEVWAMASGHARLKAGADRIVADAEDALEELAARLEQGMK